MKTSQNLTILLGFSLLLGFLPNVHAQQRFPLQVNFKKVASIQTGELANFTASDQFLRFIVFPTKLMNLKTQQDLLTSPDAVLAVEDSALRRKNDPAGSTQYCLAMIRSIAFNPTAGAEIFLFLTVTHVTATNFVVHSFDSCNLELP